MPSRPKVRGWALAVAIAVALLVLYWVRPILSPFVFSAALAYVLTPAVNSLTRRLHIKRWVVAGTLYVLIIAAVSGLVWWIISNLSVQPESLKGGLPQYAHRLMIELFGAEEVMIFGIQLNAEQIAASISRDVANFFSGPMQAAQLAKAGVAFGFGLILTFVLLLYFLLDGPKLARGVLMLMPPEHRPWVRDYAAQLHPLLIRYLYGLLVVVTFTAVVTWVGVGPIFDLPHPVFLAIATAILELLPVAGPVLSAALLGGTAVLHGGTIWTLLGFALFCLILRLLIDQVVGPLVLGKVMLLSPVTIIFAFLAGGSLFGIVGVFLAIPVTAAVKLFFEKYYSLPIGH